MLAHSVMGVSFPRADRAVNKTKPVKDRKFRRVIL